MVERLYSVGEAAEALRKTNGAVYAMIHRKQLRAVRVGERALRIRESDLKAVIRPAK